MIQINPNTVTHIKVFNLTEGVYTRHYGLVQFLYVPYKKGNFFRETVNEAYYSNGLPNRLFTITYSMDEVEESTKIFVRDGKLFTKPHIEIYAGDALIHTEYFPSNIDMGYHITENYKHVNIKY